MRETPIANGRFLINHSLDGNIRDIFYPNIGKENHSQETKCPTYIKTPNGIQKLEKDGWKTELDYEQTNMVALTNAVSGSTNLKIKEFIHPKIDVLVREFETNEETKIYWELDLNINSHYFGNTVMYHPKEKALLYYKDEVWFLISGFYGEGWGIDWFQLKKNNEEFDFETKETPNAIQGNVKAVIGNSTKDKKTTMYMLAGEDFTEVLLKNNQVRDLGFDQIYKDTVDHWSKIVGDCSSAVSSCVYESDELSEEIIKQYARSVLILHTNINHNGAIVAGNDSSNLKHNSDTYQYLWPRDGAYVAEALDTAGYLEFSHKYWDFVDKNIELVDDKWFWQKYNVDGSFSSTWHSFSNSEGELQLPIQEDEMGIMLWAFDQHHKYCKEKEIEDWKTSWQKKVADFLVDYRDSRSLPKPSYDLWEEDYGVFSYTCATVYAGLIAASNIAMVYNDAESSKKYKIAAEEVKEATGKYLFSEELNRFIRDIEYKVLDNKIMEIQDTKIDASLFALWYYGMFDCDDPKIVSTMKQLEEALWIHEGSGGICRYREDEYYTKEGHPPNPWHICTLWLAYWYIEIDNKEKALELINWCIKHTPKSGVMSEQVDSLNGTPISVGPLTWSHATFIDVINEYLKI